MLGSTRTTVDPKGLSVAQASGALLITLRVEQLSFGSYPQRRSAEVRQRDFPRPSFENDLGSR
jgi:hypothetical protein